jgi:transcriptional regulator MraZ
MRSIDAVRCRCYCSATEVDESGEKVVTSGESLEPVTAGAEAALLADGAARTGFCGTYHHQVDSKGRVAVPSPFRRLLPAAPVVAPWPDRRLAIWTPEGWIRQKEMFERAAETFDQEDDFLGMLVGNAYSCEVDAQGRLLLNSWSRTWAGIRDRAVFVGRTDSIRVCSEEEWAARGGELDPERFRAVYQMAWQRNAERRRP